VINWRKLPRLTEGDAKVIASAAGFGEDITDPGSEICGLITDVDSAISDLGDARDGGDRDYVTWARETRDDTVEAFLEVVRNRLMPDVVAAEEAEAAAGLAEFAAGLGVS